MHDRALVLRQVLLGSLIGATLVAVQLPAVHGILSEIPRTPDGRPDLSGTYDVATLTPTQRPKNLGEQLALTDEEAAAVAKRARATDEFLSRASDPDREAPRVGGNVGGYNYFWLDPGSDSFKLDGKWRTSILTDPPDGRMPPMTARGQELMSARLDLWGRGPGPASNRANSSEAWWLDREVGPYDGPEIRPMGERCMLGFGSAAGPPALPVVYNNLKRIVQTKDYVIILAEMVHDARIIRIGGVHEAPGNPRWLGDSVGHWEGDTLVVETRNFRPAQSALSAPGLRQNFVTSGDLRVVERITRIDENTLRYNFTVDDPTIWTAPWSGEYPWPATDDRVFEYACHEGNYAMGNILRGARLAEKEALEKAAATSGTKGSND